MSGFKPSIRRGSRDPRDLKIYLITFLGFLFGFSITLTVFVASAYFKEAIGSDNIGVFYIVIFSVLIVMLLNLDKIFTAWGRGRTLIFFLCAQISVLILLTSVSVGYFGALLFMLFFVLYGTIMVMWDVVLESHSTDAKTGRIRGMFLSVWGIGGLLGPYIGTQLLGMYGFHMIFAVCLILYALMLAICMMTLTNLPGHRPHEHIPVMHLIKKVSSTPALRQSYYLSLILRIFYAFGTIYMPLHLRDLGFAWSEIGIMFTAMMLPFILLEYPAGVLADKKWGEKEMLIGGLVLMCISMLMMIAVTAPLFWMWIFILILSRCGCALFETMQDAYFYKHIDGKDVALINFFRTGRSLAYVLLSIVGSVILFFADIHAILIALLLVLFTGFIPLFYLKDTSPQGR